MGKIAKFNRKGQSSIEFIILVGAALFFFLIFVMSLQLNISDKLRDKQTIAVREVALNIQDEINLAYGASDGYQRQFALPDVIGNSDYSIIFNEGLVYIETEDERDAIALPIYNVTGLPVKGTNTIKRLNGTVYLNS